MRFMFADSRVHFPLLFDVTAADVSDIEWQSIAERIDLLRLFGYERDILEGSLTGAVHSYGEYGITQMRQPHGRVHFVGDNITAMNASAIEGAIESGAVAARDVSWALGRIRVEAYPGRVVDASGLPSTEFSSIDHVFISQCQAP